MTSSPLPPSRAARRPSAGDVASGRRAAAPQLRRFARVAVVLVLIGVVSATAALAAPDASPTPPDTLAATIHTATADGSVIDAAAYPTADDVHLVARRCEREALPLAAGEYVFGVFDAAGAPRSADALAQRRFTVDDFGRISGTSGDHPSVRTICPDNGSAFVALALGPLASELAPADVLWLRVATLATAMACVREGDPTGFGCDAVERTSVAFSIDPDASPTPTASPSETPGTPPTPSGSADAGSPAPSDTGSPAPSDVASPSGTPASADPSGTTAESSPPASSDPGTSGQPFASPAPTAGPSGAPNPSPAVTPVPTATPTSRPSTSPPPAGGGSVPGPTTPPQDGPAPGNTGGSWTPPALPSYVPYSIPPGYYVCPGQVITPTGCQPIDGGGTGTGATPMPSWTWGTAPSGAPVFPGINAPSGGGVAGVPAGGLPGNPAGGPVEAAVDIVAPFPRPSSVTGWPGTDTTWASGSIGASAGATSPSAAARPSASAGASGAVAAATGLSQDGASRPPQPVPTGSVTASAPPNLPIVLAVVLLVLAGASLAAVLGWARRGFVRPTRAALGGRIAPIHGMVRRVRRVGRGFGRDAGVQP